MKSVGMVGLPGAGTTALFTALTSMEGAAGRTHQAVVPVPDARVDELGRLHHSRKLVYTQLRFVETSGMVRRGTRGAGTLPAELLGHLREADALLLVARGFAPEPNPAADLADLALELTLADLAVVEGKLARDTKAARLGDAEAKRELAAVERAKTVLEAGAPLRDAPWDRDERKILASFCITIKPALEVITIDPEQPLEAPEDALPVAAELEAEVAGMDAAEASELLASFGVTERGLPRVIRAVYDRLGLITFLTAGDKESRAWEIPAGATAQEAAGAIHSDIQRGFIRAEVIAYDDLIQVGEWHQAKTKGLIRAEGKEYLMREGDVVEFRFAV